ncbi:MAG: hypothetical protein PHS84_05690 [Paludibacter sp.]|nr:hypothetical protein [Paludibacter sp.]
MKVPGFNVDFSEMIEDNLVLLSETDTIVDSKGKTINLKEGLKVTVYAHDLSSCGKVDPLIAEGIVELNTQGGWTSGFKWNCRIDNKGIYNKSQINDFH